MELAHKEGIECEERNLSLVDFYNADQVFATGTMGELTPIVEIDGRKVENQSGKNILEVLNKSFKASIPSLCEKL
jgi:branched-chain amino acid aminotransferase